MMTCIIAIISCICAVMSPLPPDVLIGKVTDGENGEPVAGAVVRSKGSFTSTDVYGKFRLPLKSGNDSVTIRCIGYETLTLSVTADFGEVRLNRQATQLNDVIVHAPDIYAKGDTLVFNVGRYSKPEDNAIIDVIKRLPGIKVKDDGTIEYQGKPINRFYLDGNDFVGGQYGLATNNISHKDIASVEVMENHQPIKALEGIEFPEEAGINLKLKEDARSRPVGVVQAGAGVEPVLYDGSVFAMSMARKMQNMITVKADNTGGNPASQIIDHGIDMMFAEGYAESLWPEYITADEVGVALPETRVRDNRSWLADAITAWKRGDTSMRVKLDYTGDRTDYRSGSMTDYLSESIATFIQNMNQRKSSHSASAQFNAEINKRGYYLKERLTAEYHTGNTVASVAGSTDLTQKVHRRMLSAVNDLKVVKRNDKRLLTLISRNRISHSPDRLDAEEATVIMQRLRTTDFRSTTETKLGRMSRFWKYYLAAGADMSYRRMDACLSGLGAYDNSETINAFISNVYAIPQVDYERGGWRMSLKAPVKWLHHNVERAKDYVNVTPGITVRRQLSSKSDVSSSTGFALSSPQAYLGIDVPILADYRNLFVGGNAGGYTKSVSQAVSYRYRNPLKAFFVNASVSFNHARSPIMSSQRFVDDMIVATVARRVSSSDTWQMKGGISKGLGHSRIVVGCDMTATLSRASSMRDDEVVGYKQVTAGASPYFKGSILRCLSANYTVDYKFSRLTLGDMPNSSHQLTQNLAAVISPCDAVNITVGAEHFLTRFPGGHTAGLVLFDSSASWQINNRARLSLKASNLLDRRQYDYVSYGMLSRTEHSIHLRGRNVIASLQYRF